MAQDEELISQYIDRASIESDTSFMLAHLKQVDDAFNALQNKKIGIEKAKGIKEIVAANKEAKKATDELTLAVREYKKILDQIATTKAKSNTLNSDAAKEMVKEKIALHALNDELKKQLQLEGSVSNSISQARANIALLTKERNNLNVSTWEGERRLQELNTAIDQNNKFINLNSASLEKRKINIGNYKNDIIEASRGTNVFTSALTKSFSALKYITYILPGIGIAGALGLIFGPVIEYGEKIFGASEATKKLAEKAKAAKEELNSLIDSFRNFGNIKDDAIGGTIAEISKVENLAAVVLDQTNSYKQRNAALQELAKINKNYFGDLTLEANSLKTLKGLVNEYTDALIQQAVIKEVESDIGKVGAAYFRQSRMVTDARKALLAYKVDLDKSNEDFVKKNNANNIRSFPIGNRGEAVRLALLTEEVNKQEVALRPLAAQYNTLRNELKGLNIESLNFKPLGDPGKGDNLKAIDGKFFAEQLKVEADAQKELSQIFSLEQTTRINAREKAAEIEKRIIEGQRDAEIQNEIDKLNAVKNQGKVSSTDLINATASFNSKVFEINQKAGFDLVRIAKSSEDDLVAIKLSSIAKQRDIDKQANEDTIKFLVDAENRKREKIQQAIDKDNAKKLSNFAINRDTELIALEKRFSAGKISEENYNQERLRIEVKYNGLILQEQIEYTKKLIVIRKARGEDVINLEEKIKALELRIVEELHKKKKKLSDQEKADLRDKLEAYKQIASSLIDTAAGLGGARVDKEKNHIQEQIDLLDQKKQKEIEAVNATLASEEEKAAKIAIINARAAAQKEQLELKQRKLDQERARFDKAAAISKIILNTAIAVVKQLGATPLPYGAPFVAAIAAAAAAELAIAIATPIPKYKHGTGNNAHPGGPAIVGDGGKREFAILPSGETIITPKTSTLVDLPQGTHVFPDADRILNTVLKMSMPQLKLMPAISDNGKLTAEDFAREGKLTREAIKNKREIHITGNHAGAMLVHKKANNWIKYLGEQL